MHLWPESCIILLLIVSSGCVVASHSAKISEATRQMAVGFVGGVFAVTTLWWLVAALTAR